MAFLRRVWMRFSKLGSGKRKKQKWRKPKGRDNKMREKRRGYPKTVSIGYGSNKKERTKINGSSAVLVYSLKDIERVTKNDVVIIGKIGAKKKHEMIKKLNEKGIKIVNVNAKKFLKETSKNTENKK